MTADRFVLADANINATMIIDGGANRTGVAVRALDGAGRFGHNGNLDILEARNASVVTIGDLSQISNVSNLLFTNDTSITQTSTLQLDNATVDRLVNNSLTVVNTNATTIDNSFEVLDVRANDSLTPGAFTQLNLDASQVTQGALRLNIVAGGGSDTIIAGAGNDTIAAGGGNDTLTLGGGNDSVVLARTLANNGLDAINGFAPGTLANGGDVLNVSAFTFNGGTTPTVVELADVANITAAGIGNNRVIVLTANVPAQLTAAGIKGVLDANDIDTTNVGDRLLLIDVGADVAVFRIFNGDAANDNNVVVEQLATLVGVADIDAGTSLPPIS